MASSGHSEEAGLPRGGGVVLSGSRRGCWERMVEALSAKVRRVVVDDIFQRWLQE